MVNNSDKHDERHDARENLKPVHFFPTAIRITNAITAMPAYITVELGSTVMPEFSVLRNCDA
jgi:hypothetical protein